MSSSKQIPLTNEQLSQFLEETMPYVGNSIPTIIRHGGCGVFANMLHEKLSQCGYASKIIVYIPRYSEDGINFLLKHNALNDSLYSGILHAVVEINGRRYDDNGNAKHMRKQEYELTSQQMQLLINDRDMWNSDFDRSCIPLLQLKMDEVFGKISEYYPGMWSSINTGHVPLNHYSEAHEIDIFGFLNLKNEK